MSKPDMSDPRPLASAESIKSADIIASCYDNWTDVRHNNWGNLVDAAVRCTPGGSCVWDGVAFTRGERPQPDWHIILNNLNWDRKTITFKGSPNRTIFAICEPPTVIHRPWHEAQGEGTIVLTCDGTLEHIKNAPRRYISEVSLTPTWAVDRTYDFLRQHRVAEKPKTLSWVCSAEMVLSGHHYRLKFLEALKSRIQFDHFGRGFNPIQDKWDALAPYRYSIAFENSKSDYYLSEKLGDCFVAETMPFYYGSDKIGDYFPEGSFVVIDPEDPDVFRIIKDVMASDLWLKNREAILEAKRLVLEKYNVFARLARFMQAADDAPEPLREMTFSNIVLNYGLDA